MSKDLNKQLCELCGIEGKEREPECLCIDTPACCPENCTGCKYFNRFEKVYPDFTPEKQLELIKLLVNTKKVECFYIQKRKNDFKISCLLETTNFAASVIATDPAMDTALAKILIKLIQKSELDKSEVKRILEDD